MSTRRAGPCLLLRPGLLLVGPLLLLEGHLLLVGGVVLAIAHLLLVAAVAPLAEALLPLRGNVLCSLV